jgi:hypothetical protein
MDSLIWLFFESTLALTGCLALLLFVLLVHWRRTLKPRPLLIGLALAVVLLLIQALVVTRREHADRTMKAIERDVLVSRTDAIAAALSTRFHIAETNWDREKFIDRVRQYMQSIDVRTLNRRMLEIKESEADTFQIIISYLADIRATDYAGPVLSRWKIVFVREGGRWKIQRIEPTQLGRAVIHGWKGLPRP